MQQLPPFPDDQPGFSPGPEAEPGNPGTPAQPSTAPAEAQPSTAPAEAPQEAPAIDVPSPSTPGTEAPSTPISPIG
jgi:hypothetical protein